MTAIALPSLDTVDGLDSIALTVPDLDAAVALFAELTGAREYEHSRANSPHGRQLRLAVDATSDLLLTEHPADIRALPRITDLGTHHLCLRVGDIDAAVGYLRAHAHIDVLGDVITTPDGPIAGNRWVYFRLPWGTLAELQQWPDDRPYEAGTDARLWFGQRPLAGARLPSLLGVDHSGHSVRDLDATVAFLRDRLGAVEVLRTEIAADTAFMRAQFDADVAGRSRMAMLRLGARTNVELFQHDLGHGYTQAPPRDTFAAGGCALVLRGDGGSGGGGGGAPVWTTTGFGPDLGVVG